MSKENKITQQELAWLYNEIANGDQECLDFVIAWQNYCHGIDDLIDGAIPLNANREKVRLFFEAAKIYNSNYWRRYGQALYILVPLITTDYCDSNEPEMPNAQFLASAGNNMLKAIAYIQGGYGLLERVSGRLNKMSFIEHGEKGEE